ncbi:hypothetical protein CHS0354_021444 [Potamilus streckersoni]|uniref:FAM194 C-terminal domain-containing protein n=1 Tax=Potamilus streckersoni TaxID=2493646 RepID=A0AAE0VMT7_9BIVA|nr:hypothetical protein CHS0354_021444 [Potamilus streckersoni]
MNTGRRPGSASSIPSVGSLPYYLRDDIMTDQLDSVEFPKGKPLPPIGGGGGDSPDKHDIAIEDQYEEENFEDDADDRSTTSPAILDTPGEGKARPKVVRSFRAEIMDEVAEKTSPSPTRSMRRARKDAQRSESPATIEKFRRKTFDGQELNFVTLDTQTDWDWVYYVRETGNYRSSSARTAEDEEKSGGSPRIVDDGKTAEEGQLDHKTSTDTPLHLLPLNDEYGIPLLELSSDTEDTSDEESARKKTRDKRNFIPSIGPPQILQYIRESEKHELKSGGPETKLQPVAEEKDVAAEILQKGTCEFCGKPLLPFPTLDQQLQSDPSQLYCCSEYREFVEFSMKTAIEMENARKEIKLINIKPHGHHGSKQDRKAAKEKAFLRMRQRELERKAQEASGLQAAQAFFSFARQMKTINYQLSSVKCMEEGWTLRPPSPHEDELGDDVFTPEPFDPDLLIQGKLYERPIINKTYESGQKFLTIFPDGTGNVFYPSGHLAILIFSVTLGTYCYTIHDPQNGMPIAGFDASGLGFCYFFNGGIRIYTDQYGGIELDKNGSRRRKWIWKDQVTHNHAPPFQPITFALNQNIAVRIMSQDNVVVTFNAQRRSCRFNMGTKLKMVAPENIVPQEIEEERIYLSEKKVQVEALLDKVENLLKFPNSPKIDKILPPLHISAQVHRNQKLRKEQAKAITARATKNKKIMPAVSVN